MQGFRQGIIQNNLTFSVIFFDTHVVILNGLQDILEFWAFFSMTGNVVIS